MIASTAIACALAVCAAADAQTVPGVLDAVREGDFQRAHMLAGAEPAPLPRAQAESYLRHHAGDLLGAYAAARAGLDHDPANPWLLERATYIALSLRDLPAARAHLTRLEHTLSTSEPGSDGPRESWRASAAAHRSDLLEISRVLGERDSAVLRARSVGGAALALVLGLLAILSRGGRSEHGGNPP